MGTLSDECCFLLHSRIFTGKVEGGGNHAAIFHHAQSCFNSWPVRSVSRLCMEQVRIGVTLTNDFLRLRRVLWATLSSHLCDNLSPLLEADGRKGFYEHSKVLLPAVLEEDALLDSPKDKFCGFRRLLDYLCSRRFKRSYWNISCSLKHRFSRAQKPSIVYSSVEHFWAHASLSGKTA